MKQLLPVLFALITTPALSQQGAWYVGGDVSASSNTSRSGGGVGELNSKNFTWNVAPDAGIYLSNHLQVGAGISIGGAKTTSENLVYGSTSNSKSTTYGGMILSRYFFTTTLLRPFAGLTVHATGSNTSYEHAPVSSKSLTINGRLTAGFAYSFTPRFCALASVGTLSVEHSEETPDNGTGNTNINDRFSFFGSTNASTFNLGVQYIIPKRKHIQEVPPPVGE